MFNLFVGSLLNQSLDQLQLAMGQCNHCNAVHAAVQIPTQLHTDGFSPLKRSRAAWNAQLVAANAKMSKDSISSTPCPQGKLKRTQEHDIDLEAGSSKKKLVTSHSGSQQESPGQPEIQQATGEKPSFRVIGHFVMAMKRFQASLNPTYTYGKVHEDSGASSTSSGDFVHPAQRILRKQDPQNGSGQDRAMKKTLSSRGNKTNLLFKQLPDVPTET